MRRIVWLWILAIVVCTSACSNNTREPSNSRKDTGETQDSFTSDKSYSYDEKYYALQNVEQSESVDMIKVSVYIADTDELIYEFAPARALDFHGICWESSTYNIWIQSGDVGVLCYAYKDETWILDRNAKRPKDILSKYDKGEI